MLITVIGRSPRVPVPLPGGGSPPPSGNFIAPSWTLPTGITFDTSTGWCTGSVYTDTGTFDTTGVRQVASPSNLTAAADFTPADAAALVTALASSASMDDPVIQLTPGVDYTRTGTAGFTLPARTGSGYCVIRAGTMAGLPSRGGGATAAATLETLTANMAAITPPTQAAVDAITVGNGVHHYWFAGIEVTLGPFAGGASSSFISLLPNGSHTTTLSNYPHHIVFERCYFHAAPGSDAPRRPVNIGGEYIAFEDCAFRDIQSTVSDAQCFSSFGYTRYLKIVGCYTLTKTAETILFGGAQRVEDSLTQLPEQIEIRRNRFQGDINGTGGVFKNLLELKWARYGLVEGNVFRYCWRAGQEGFAWQFGVQLGINQTNVTTSDWTVMYNKVHDTAMPFILLGMQLNGQTPGATSDFNNRLEIRDNLFFDQNVTPYHDNSGAVDWNILFSGGGLRDLIIRHNTVVFGGNCRGVMSLNRGTWSALPVVDGFDCQDNIFPQGGFGMFASTGTEGTDRWNTYTSNGTWDHNAIYGGSSGTNYPAVTWFPAAVADIGFTDLANDDYQLGAGTGFDFRAGGANESLDGKDLGVDIDMVLAATAGV